MLSYNLTEIKIADLKSRQFVLQLLGKLIATVIIEIKS